jgi:hypothetical protein
VHPRGENKEMSKRHRQGIHITLAWLSIVLIITPISATALQVGDQAPDFMLFSTIGESQSLSDYQGKKQVLLFFFVRAFGGA